MADAQKTFPVFIGASGGCLLGTLTRTLKAGYECNALARTPSKLTDLLLKNGVSQDVLDSKLHITKGDVRDVPTIKASLTHNGRLVDIIISGVGATTMSEINSKTLDICQTTITNVIEALNELKTEGHLSHKPLLVPISSTGISDADEPRDLPILWIPAYKFLLANPHRDKLEMEHIIEKHMAKGEADHVIRGYVLPRPAWLTNGPAQGEDVKNGLRVGREDAPAVGYTVSREDVGLWIFKHIVEGVDRESFINHKPSLAY